MKIEGTFKKMFSKKSVLAILVICVICVCEFFFGNVVIYDHILYRQEDVMSLLCDVYDYQVSGRTYEMAGDDPQLLFRSDISYIDTVRVKFAEPVKEDMVWTVYYDDGSGLSQSKSVIGRIEKGEENAQLSLPPGKYQHLRLDIDGDFSIEDIFFEGSEAVLNYVKCFFYVILCVFINLLVWVFRGKVIEKLYWLYRHVAKISNKLNGFVYDFFVNYHIKVETLFLFLAIILGIGYSFLLPPGEVPDEPNHMLFLERAFGLNEETERESQEYIGATGFNEVCYNKEVKQDVHLLKETARIKFSDTARDFTGNIKITIIRYLPAGLGFCIGILLNLPIYFCLILAEICAVLFYAIMGYFALKQMPIMKNAFCLAMLMPMTLQQCSSINYDAVLLPLCFWLVSYIMQCAYVKERVTWRNLFLMLAVSVYILLIKPPYVLLLLLFFVIPKEKIVLSVAKTKNLYEIFCKRWYIFCIIFLAAFCVGLYIFKENTYIRIFYMWFTDFPKMLEIYYDTIEQLARFYIVSLVGNFGWLVFPMPMSYVYFTLFILVMSAICYNKGNNLYKHSWRQRTIYASIAILLILVIIFTMFTWTFFLMGADIGSTYESLREVVYSINRIDGVQGRYFIPVVPLVLLALHGLMHLSERKVVIYYILIFIIWEAIPIASLIERFWV